MSKFLESRIRENVKAFYGEMLYAATQREHPALMARNLELMFEAFIAQNDDNGLPIGHEVYCTYYVLRALLEGINDKPMEIDLGVEPGANEELKELKENILEAFSMFNPKPAA